MLSGLGQGNEQLRRLPGVLLFTNKRLKSLSRKNQNADQAGMIRRLIDLKLFIRIGKAAFLITQLINTTP